MSKFLSKILLGTILSLTIGVGFVAAQEEGQDGMTASNLSDALTLEEPASPAPLDESLFQYPEDASPAELLAFVENLEKSLPQPKSEEELNQIITKIAKIYQEIADKILGNDEATDEEKSQARQLKVVAFQVESQMGNAEAGEKLSQMLDEMIANAKDDEAKIQAYQIKIQATAQGGQRNPATIDKIEAIADRILAENPDSDELQIFGLEVKAQTLFTKAQMNPEALEKLVEFTTDYLASDKISQATREKAQEMKLAALTAQSMTDESKEGELDRYFEELMAGNLSPEAKATLYKMRIQSLMGGGGQPGAPSPAPKPENAEKIAALADRLIAEESDELKSLGYAVKSASLLQKAQNDPAEIDALFAYADEQLAANPSDELKMQMTGLKIQGYMLRIQQDNAAAKEMLAFLDAVLADNPTEEVANRVATVKLHVLMMQMQEDASYAEELEKTLGQLASMEGFDKNQLQSGWAALYVGKVKNLAANGGSIEDLNPILEEMKAKLPEMPILAFILGSLAEDFQTIGENNNDPELVKRVFTEFVDLTKDSENQTLQRVSVQLQNVLETLSLTGKEVALEGILVGEDKEKKFNSSELAGKYFVIDLWSMSDQSYFETLEELTELYKEFQPKGFEIVGINTDEKANGLERSVEVLGMTWNVLSDQWTKDAGMPACSEGLPTLPPGEKILVGPDGKIVLVADLAKIRETLVEKLGEPESTDSAE